MNTNALASLIINEGLRTIKVSFSQNRNTIDDRATALYTYKTLDDTIKENDIVVVKVGDRIKTASVIKVDAVADLTGDFDYQWIVQKVDTTEYDKLNEMEQGASEKLRELEQKTMIENAKDLLSESLGLSKKQLNKELGVK